MDAPRRITEDEMYEALEEAIESDPEQSLIWQLTERMTDPLKPESERGHRRFHPLLALVALALIIVASFLYFGVFQNE